MVSVWDSRPKQRLASRAMDGQIANARFQIRRGAERYDCSASADARSWKARCSQPQGHFFSSMQYKLSRVR